MAIEYRSLSNLIGYEVLGADLSQPLSEAELAEINRRWVERCILVFRNQQWSVEDQKLFSMNFGTLDIHIQKDFLLKQHPEVLCLSNVKDENGRPIGSKDGGRHWHTDLYWKEFPAKASLLYGKETPPERGDTQFINMYTVYDNLPAHLKKAAEGKRVVISRVRSWPIDYAHRPPLTEAEKSALPDVIHPLVRRHPETGRKCIYIGNEQGVWIVGMPDDEARALLTEIMTFAKQFAYGHKWRQGDAILWDNRSAMHCATPYDEINHRRIMYRTTIMDGVRPV